MVDVQLGSGRSGIKWQLVCVSELSKSGSRTWGGIPSGDDVGSSNTLWQRREGRGLTEML